MASMREYSLLSLGPHGFHRVAYTEWGDAANPHVVICVHGLTRNRHDFDYLARHLCDRFRVVCLDVAGRGDSDWLEHKEDYSFTQYQNDAAALIARVSAPAPPGRLAGLLARHSVRREPVVDWVGTSMGGLIGMLLAAQPKSPLRRLVLNDIGPLIPWTGLVRLKGYAGRGTRFQTLDEVEAFLRDVCAPFGELSDEQWRHLATHGAQALPEGGYALSYDPDIMRTLRSGAHLGVSLGERFMEGVDLWRTWDRIGCPTLVLRGADSDVLTERTVQEMATRGPKAEVIEIPGVGHAPALMEEAQIRPLRDFLLR